MAKNSKSKKAIPIQMLGIVSQLGFNIQIARKKRGLSRKQLAEKMLVSIPTLTRLENGDASISLGVIVNALWCLGIYKELSIIAAPEMDEIGNAIQNSNLKKRIRAKKMDNNF